MKTMTVVAVLVLLGSSRADAVDIEGKWGIGAALFGGGGEVSLIRGKSERSAWLFDVSVGQQSLLDQSDPSSPTSIRRTGDWVRVSAGPGYRRFARATDELSPYWDLTARFLYSRIHQRSSAMSDLTLRQVGADLAFRFGLEYSTPWRFSVAAHSRIVEFTWTHDRSDQRSPFSQIRSSGHTQSATLGLTPVIYLRGYF